MEEGEAGDFNANDREAGLYPVLEKPSADCGVELEDGNTNTPDKISSPASAVPSISNSIETENSRTDGFNFWDVNGYKKTVKRIDDGAKLCDDLMKLISERAEIESLYAGRLQGWSRKWNDLINKGTEFGSLKQSWLSMCSEADQLAQIHLEIQRGLTSTVQQNVLSWKSANYHKAIINWKQTKNAEEGFAKGQKPWAKKYDAVAKCKRAYYAACKAHDQAKKLYNDAKMTEDAATTEEQVKKLLDKTVKTNNDVTSTQEKYRESLRDISNYNPKYKEDMCYVFDKCQKAEGERRTFFKQSFLNYCQVLDLRQYAERFSHIYQGTHYSFNTADVDADLHWFATTWGSDMLVKWPQYEEYNPEEIQTAVTQPSQTATAPPTVRDTEQESPQVKKSSVCTTL